MTARATFNGQLIAESDETIIVEGNHYFPAESVESSVLVPSSTTTHCPWKGTAHYHSVVVDGREATDAAWYYPEPLEEAAPIAGYLAFWRGVEVQADAGDGRPGPRA